MEQGTDLGKCDRCGRESHKRKERVVHTAWQDQRGRMTEPRRQVFRLCPRCVRNRESISENGQVLFALAMIAFGSWLINFPAFFWRWPSAPHGHGALGAALTAGLAAVGIVAWASFSLKRWLRNKAFDALSTVDVPGWSPGEITAEKYSELIAYPETGADIGLAGPVLPFEPGHCGACLEEEGDTPVRIVLRTGREIASEVTDIQRVANTLVTTHLKTYGGITDYEARICRSCWVDRNRRLKWITVLFAVLFPAALITGMITLIGGIEDDFLGLGLTALFLVGGLSFFLVMMKWLVSRQPGEILTKRVAAFRNKDRAKDDFIVISSTWRSPRP